eukprot:COSAG06_NODE_36_length_30622_cov_18.404869_2_plen_93_part_00
MQDEGDSAKNSHHGEYESTGVMMIQPTEVMYLPRRTCMQSFRFEFGLLRPLLSNRLITRRRYGVSSLSPFKYAFELAVWVVFTAMLGDRLQK